MSELHWHPPEAEDMDLEPCTDAACRHVGARFRHSRPCPPDDNEHADVPCDYQLLHRPDCRCARCDPEFAASRPKWSEQPDAYTFTRAMLRAQHISGNSDTPVLSARERFAQMQAEKRAVV